ncbi:MAG TPA: PAS domain-containing protein [Gemmataceae bacterium]|nr:PAS domain-containing protein [Gemmataceae bacterium]
MAQRRPTILPLLTAAPVVLLPIGIAALYLWGSANSHESADLLLIANFIFTTLVSLFIGLLAGRSFLLSGRLPLLAVCLGMIVWGISALVAATGEHVGNYNLTIHNLGVLTSGLCHFSGAISARTQGERGVRAPGAWLGLGIATSLGAVGVIWMGTLEGWLPPFYIEGQGATPLRTFVLSASILLFIVAAALTGARYRVSEWRFLFWYALGLALIAIGAAGLILQPTHGSWLGWVARLTQYLGGIYMLVGTVNAMHESGAWQFSLERRLQLSEQAQHDQAELIRYVNDNTSELIFMKDRAGRLTYANAATLRLLGRETLPPGTNDLELFRVAAEHAAITDNDRHVMETGKVLEAEEPFTGADGQKRIFLSTKSPLRDATGQVVGVIGVSRDITDRKRTDQRVRGDLQAMKLLRDIGQLCSRADSNLKDCLAATLDAAILFADADKGNVQVLQVDRDVLEISVYRGFTESFLKFFGRVRSGEFAVCGAAFQEQNRIVVEDVTRSELFRGQPALQVLLGEGVRAVQSTPLVSSTGKVLGMISTHWARPTKPDQRALGLIDLLARQAADLLERQNAEQALRASEQRLDLALNAAAMGVWQWDFATNALTWDQRTYAIFGVDTAAFHPSLAALEQMIDPQDNAEARRLFEEACRGNGRYQLRFRISRPDGAERWLHNDILILRDDRGTPRRVVGTVQDITGAVEAEEALRDRAGQLRFVTDNAPVMLVHCDARGRYLFVNEPYARRFGRRPEDCVGKQILEVVGKQAFASIQPFIDAALRGQRVETEQLVHFDYGDHWMHWVYVPQRDEYGVVTGFVAVIQDISARKQAEDDLRHAKEAAEAASAALRDADRRKDEFLATLAHELRNPLAPIRNGLAILSQSTGDPAKFEQATSMMGRQLQQMVRLIDDLLDMSRVSRGKLELRFERVELASVIRHAVESCRPLVESGRHELTVELPAEPVWLNADSVRLTQVVGNLINNACKFTQDGGQIQLTAERQGSDVVVAVKDNGIGIPDDKIDAIFELFTQVDRTLEKSQGGLGIGLTLVKQLVEMHGGSIAAQSEGPGKGTEFLVRLPVAVDEAPTHAVNPTDMKVSGRRVLVVDDNRDSAESLGMLLKMMGNEVFMAHDGQEAVETAARVEPDAIVLDIGLPKLNGYEACRRIRQQAGGAEMTIIAVTGWGQDDDRRKSREAGFNGHLVKPVDPSALLKFLSPATAVVESL